MHTKKPAKTIDTVVFFFCIFNDIIRKRWGNSSTWAKRDQNEEKKTYAEMRKNNDVRFDR